MTFTAEIQTTELASAEQPSEIKPIKVRKTRAPKHDFKNGEGRVFAHKHVNGNGWVADTARVEDTVYVGARAAVYNFARVSGTVRLEGCSRIYGHANVSGNVILKQYAHIFGRATVRDRVQLHGHAQISGASFLGGDSSVYDSFIVTDHAHVLGCRLMGSGMINGDAIVLRSNISGSARITGSANVSQSTLDGRILIDGAARVFGSNLTLRLGNDDAQRIHVTNSAVLTNGANIYAPIEIKDSAIVQSSTLYVRDWRQHEPMRITNQTLIVQTTFNTHAEFAAFLNAAGRRPGRNDATPTPAQWSLPATQQIAVLPPTNRRVMRVS